MNSLIVTAALTGAFNLACSGTETVTKEGKVEQHGYAELYRVDLVSRRWCNAACGSLEPVAALSPDEIVLVDSETSAGIVRNKVDRRSGAHVAEVKVAFVDYALTRQGRCAVKGFSGFPGGRR